jgi:small GTP-binding protein
LQHYRKSSLVARFVHSIFSDKYHTTVGVKVDKKVCRIDDRDITLMLWDMAGEEENAPVKTHLIRGASGYLLVVDGCRRKTLDVALSIQQRVENEIGQCPFLLLANKADERSKWEIPDSAWKELKKRGWTVLETSAKTGKGVEEAFFTLCSRILNVQDDRPHSTEYD